MKKPIRIAVTGGAGQICYSLLYRIAAGEMFGKDQPVIINILEVPAALEKLKGSVMELQDCAFPLLAGIVTGDNPARLFEGVEVAILVGAKPRSKGMERGDLLIENAGIFAEQAKHLNHQQIKVLVVGNPANTNALVFLHNAKKVPPENIRSMMRLDQNRAIAQLAIKTGVPTGKVKKVAVYGNHSTTMVIDYCNATIEGKPAREAIRDDRWLQGEFLSLVQNRGAEIINARGLSSAASAANAAIDSIIDWTRPTPEGDWYTAGVYSHKNPYGIADDIFFSFPMRNNQIVAGLKVDEFLEKKIEATTHELLKERDLVKKYLS